MEVLATVGKKTKQVAPCGVEAVCGEHMQKREDTRGLGGGALRGSRLARRHAQGSSSPPAAWTRAPGHTGVTLKGVFEPQGGIGGLGGEGEAGVRSRQPG